MDVYSADGHDLLSVSRAELPNQHGDERVQLAHLFLIILLHGILKALLEPGEGHPDINGPPDLSTGERNLTRVTTKHTGAFREHRGRLVNVNVCCSGKTLLQLHPKMIQKPFILVQS